MRGECISNCGIESPPPDSIIYMPPPPLPSFLLPKSFLFAPLSNNDSNSALKYPCFATFLCEPNPRPRESGKDFVEFSGENTQDLESTWIFVLISFCIGVVILGSLLAILLLKCRGWSYHSSNIKQGAMTTLRDKSKTNSFISGGILYPSTSTNNSDILQNQLTNESRLLWATLTPHGTRHFIAHNPATISKGRGTLVCQERPYEVVDYGTKVQSLTVRDNAKGVPNKSFDNNGFVDYDYEDPTPLMDSYHDDLDSGYQEPQEIISSITGTAPRPLVSTPTRIDSPNMAPLNYFPSCQRNVLTPNTLAIYNDCMSGTIMNRSTAVCRRTFNASSTHRDPKN